MTGFTLVETLGVAVLAAALAALLLPALSQARTKARRLACESNLRQLGAASMMYIQDHDGTFPSSQLFHVSGSATPGIHDYVGDERAYKCPALARDGQFDPAHLRDTGGNTYSVSLTATANSDGTSWALYRLSRIEVPSRTAWILDGAWSGAFFNSVIGRNQLDTMLPRLLYPHGDAENVLFVDGHVETFRRGTLPADPAVSFWTGKK